MIKPDEMKHSPEVLFPQENEGTCGISAFSSAFAIYMIQIWDWVYILKKKNI